MRSLGSWCSTIELHPLFRELALIHSLGVLKATYDLNDCWRLGAGYRTLAGGADTDDVYSFGWLHYGVLDVSYRF